MNDRDGPARSAVELMMGQSLWVLVNALSSPEPPDQVAGPTLWSGRRCSSVFFADTSLVEKLSKRARQPGKVADSNACAQSPVAHQCTIGVKGLIGRLESANGLDWPGVGKLCGIPP